MTHAKRKHGPPSDAHAGVGSDRPRDNPPTREPVTDELPFPRKRRRVSFEVALGCAARAKFFAREAQRIAERDLAIAMRRAP